MTFKIVHAMLVFGNLVLAGFCLFACWYAVRDGSWLTAFVNALIAIYVLYQSLPRIVITLRTTPIMDKDEDAYRMIQGVAEAISASLPKEMRLYVLEGHEPVQTINFVYWAMRRDKDYRVALTSSISGIEISTVFLGMEHNWRKDGSPPLLFETMIFGGEHDGDLLRSATWDEAVRIHEEMCALVRREHVEAET